MRGTMGLIFDSIGEAHATRRDVVEALNFAPTLAFTRGEVQTPTMSLLAKALPTNVKLMTVASNYADFNAGKTLLRFAHKYEVGEHPVLSQPATFSLAEVFATAGLNVTAATEMTLTGNQEKGAWEAKKKVWPTSSMYANAAAGGAAERVAFDEEDEAMTVTIRAMELKTFLVAVDPVKSTDTSGQLVFKSDDTGTKSQRAWSAEGAALTGVTFSFLNQFNSTTEPIQFVDSSVQLFAGAWAPSPLAPPLSGSLPPVKGNALRYGFRAEVDPLVPPGNRINGTFQLRPAPNAGNLSQGFAAFGFVLVPVGAGRQEFIVQTEGATWDELASESYTVMVGGEVVVTVLLHHRDCLPSCHPLCTC